MKRADSKPLVHHKHDKHDKHDEHDETLDYLRALSHRALLDYAVAIGGYLVERYFAGRVELYYDRDPHKEASFRTLCTDHAEALSAMGLSTSTLKRYIRAFDVWRRLPHRAQRGLSLQQVTLLGRVADPISREKLAIRHEAEDWAPARLKAEIQTVREANLGERAKGRPRQPPAERALRTTLRSTRQLAALRPQASRLPSRSRLRLLAELDAAVAELNAWRAELDDGLPREALMGKHGLHEGEDS
jgi:hypothetical protein